jgi:hypothetical protein
MRLSSGPARNRPLATSFDSTIKRRLDTSPPPAPASATHPRSRAAIGFISASSYCPPPSILPSPAPPPAPPTLLTLLSASARQALILMRQFSCHISSYRLHQASTSPARLSSTLLVPSTVRDPPRDDLRRLRAEKQRGKAKEPA